jgi:release factor glutamine methyltransferase
MMAERQPGTIREAYAEASSFLSGQGVADAASNAELLLQHLLGWGRSEFLMRMGEPFPAAEEARWRRLLERKAGGEPAQYIIGEQEFYGLAFAVTPAVLIPRPETELLVERIIRLGGELWPAGTGGDARDRAKAIFDGDGKERRGGGGADSLADRRDGPHLADVGTGSGAIPVTVAVQCPAWRLAASDISAAALEVAAQNAQRNGVGGRIEFLEGDLLLPYVERGIAPDILMSNPPYIPTGEISGLQPEVKSFEPHTALDGGEDGLIFYRRLVDQMALLPAYPTLVGFEVGQGQAPAVRGMLEAAGRWTSFEIIPDLAGIERHVVAYGLK